MFFISHLDKICPICLDEFTNPTRTKCGHQFCSGCLEKALKYDPFCPTCKQALRPIIGKQPQGGQMTHRVCPDTYCIQPCMYVVGVRHVCGGWYAV